LNEAMAVGIAATRAKADSHAIVGAAAHRSLSSQPYGLWERPDIHSKFDDSAMPHSGTAINIS